MRLVIFSILTFLFFQADSQTLSSIESVEYDASQNRFLISNGNSIIARNSDGSLEFFGNGQANYGMEVMGENLFAIDGQKIRGYNLATGQEVMSVTISGSSFLNGLANDGNSKLWATDFGSNRIYEIDASDLSNPTFSTLISNTGTTPNGIIHDAENNRLIYVSWGAGAAIRQVDLTDNSLSTIINTPYGNIDGIDEDNEGNYYISRWSPAGISKYDKDFANPPEVITVPGISTPADIGYAKEIDTLGIPSGGNTLLLIGFEPVDSMVVSANYLDHSNYNLSIFPNPVSEISSVNFTLQNNEAVSL